MFNTPSNYGWVAIVFHWGSVVVIFLLFALGYWMTGLDYYDSWYKKGPDLHRAIGILFFIFLTLRVLWRRKNIQPNDEPTTSPRLNRIAHRVHIALYILLFLIMTAGYFISTADGRSVAVFELFEVPALISNVENQEDIAGAIHWYLALTMMILVGLHAAAALKHHFLDKDQTLLKMFGIATHNS